MIVVSDTSPLIYLNLVGAIDVLPQIFGRVYVPGAVLQEIKESTGSLPVLHLRFGERGTAS